MTEGRLSALARSLVSHAAEAAIGRSRIVNPPLREHLRARLAQPPGEPGSLLADPVLEGAFGHLPAEETLQQLAARGLLHPATVAALAETTPLDPAESRGRSTLPASLRPYTHQVEAWEALKAAEPRCVLVSAGTGSGKTESFLVPILDDLARQAAASGQLVGVQALLLYPLNALIASQRDRLSDWTAPFGGDVRFCLYNGNTPEELPAREVAARPWEVLDRTTLRRNPPPLLVTNATMLEYMLLRGKDAPILAASRGRLRYVVLDEAHTYLGSQAAEMTLLLRRTLHAFGVAPGEVRFIATSATLGRADDPAVESDLRRFLADLGGVAEEKVTVVIGRRHVPPLLPGSHGGLEADRAAVALRDRLARESATLSELRRLAAPADADALLERGMASRGPAGEPFLPLRLHLFHRAQAGLWACMDPACAGRAGTTLDTPAWPFGKVMERDSPACDTCGGRTLSILLCDECGAPFLDTEMDAGLERVLRPRDAARFDEFGGDAEDSAAEDAEGDDDAAGSETLRFLLGPAGLPDGARLNVEPATGAVRDTAGPGRVPLTRHDRLDCPCCGTMEGRRQLFRPVRLGGPFFVGVASDVLLDAAPPRAPAVPPLPHAGRQIITFTDNRQGTARFAALRQQEAERTYLRGFVTHALQAGPPEAAGRIAALRAEIAVLEGHGGPIAALAAQKRGELASLEAGGAVPWPSLLARLAEANANQPDLLDLWRGIDRDVAQPARLAELQLLTEFLRRPQRANNLETMGLATLRYPPVDRLSAAFMPPLLRDRGATLADWQDFLHLVMDFFVRANSAVQIQPALANWLGQRARPRAFLDPREPGQTGPRERRWPVLRGHTGRTSRPVLLLRDGLGLDLDDPATQEAVNETLEAAWRVLQGLRSPALERGFRLDLAQVEVAPLREAWLCPLTRRLLPRCFRGVTPYVTHRPDPARPACRRFTMPRLPHPWLRTDQGEDARDATEAWLREDPDVQALRGEGLWTDLQDKAVRRAPFVRTVEHSAQQPPARLREYETRFKAGRINVLNCSTTMEMGVDIGGITTVAMANVPPSPASYRQRVGRAGRRGEALSVAFTYCQDTPLGWHAFDRPGAPLREAIAPPRVALESRPLVQRHVNALLLGRFLRLTEADGLSLEAKAFFDPDLGEQAPWARFRAWLGADAYAEPGLADAIARVVARTTLAGVDDLTGRCADALLPIAQAWIVERDALVQDLAATDVEAARRAIEVQLKRMDGEFLLGELAHAGFLPGHGFATDVVPFVALSPADREAARGATGGREREDAGSRARRFPTRQLDMAIREYAPGGDVVVDNIVYRSAGVTLNWKRPATAEESAELQSIRWFWRCGACDGAGTAASLPEQCSACGSEALARQRVLQPAGFSADLLEPPTNAVETVAFVPPSRPVVSARGAAWTSLENPGIGRARATTEGTLMVLSRGAAGHGYALCLACGRAEPERSPASDGTMPPLPGGLDPHAPLRAQRRRSLRCDGPERGFPMQRHLALGFARRTDIFELQLLTVMEERVATTLAAALREALCRRLGIERDEIAWHVDRTPLPDGGRGWSIFLFDTVAGGAGYATTAAAEAGELLRQARGFLNCSNAACDSACPSCLVVRDTVHVAHLLDRRAAAAVLDGLLASLVLPAEARVFGTADERMATAPLPLEIDRALAARPRAALWLPLHGEPSEWDIAPWWATGLVERLGRQGRSVTIAAAEASLRRLSFDEALALKTLLDRAGPAVRLMGLAREPVPASLLAAVVDETRSEAWAARAGEARVGAEPAAVILRAPVADPPMAATPAPDLQDLLRRLKPTTYRLTIGNELDGPIGGFGQRFWAALRGMPGLSAWLARGPAVTSVAYSDRYLFSPIAVRLLNEVLRALPLNAAGEGRIPLRITTLGERMDRRIAVPSALRDDWPDMRIRDAVLRGSLGIAGFDVSLETADRHRLPHARRLVIKTASQGDLEVLFEHGFGHWTVPRFARFDFTATPVKQAAELLRSSVSVAGDEGRPTYLFVDIGA